jgi:heme exporter protein D
MLSVVATALGIVVLVAVPNLRQGSGVLSPNAKRAVRRARQQAKKKPMAAAGGTWRGLVGTWRGVVAVKRLVGRLTRRIVETASTVGREPQAERVDVPRVVGEAEVGRATMAAATAAPATVDGTPISRPAISRPRTTPTDSGPIPEVTPDNSHRRRVTAGAGGSARRSR